MKLHYQAKQSDGTRVDGEIEADSPGAARRKLREQGLFPLSIDAAKAARGTTFRWRAGRRGVKPHDIVVVMSQLTIMCQSGVDLAEAIRNVAEQCPRPALKNVLDAVYGDVAAGLSFSESLQKHPHVFSETLVAGIAAGESSGTIVEVLQRLTQLMRADIRLRSGIWSMLMYPLVLCGVTALVLCAMVFFVLPQFAKVFADLDRTPPPMTAMLLSSAQTIRQNWIIVFAALGGLSFAAFRLRHVSAATRLWDYATLNLAILRNSTRSLSTGRTFRLLGTMLQSGVPLVEAIRLCRAAARNRLFRALFDNLEHDVLQGQGLTKSLLAASFLPLGAAHMVATAEKTGKLASVLQTVGEYYEDEGEKHLRDFVKVLEPAVIIVLGIIVAVVVLSVVLPLLDVSTIAR